MSDGLDALFAINDNFSSSAGPAKASSGGGFGSLFGTLLSSFGAGMSATAAYTQAQNQKSALLAQSQVEANNATLDTWQAEDAITRGQTAASIQELKGGQVKGAQRTGLAANGVDLGGGSAQNVMNSSEFMNAVDVTTIQNNAARAAWGYSMQATQATQRSIAAKSGADSVSPWLAAGTSLLTSATSVASKWYGANIKATPGSI